MDTNRLQPGRVYRTEDFRAVDANPTRVVNRLVRQGRLQALRKGMYYAPRVGTFGPVPPREDELLRAFFRRRPYLRTGPSVWNTLALGTSMVEAVPLVYNTTRSGTVRLAGRRFELRRTRFPLKPTTEFFVVDLLENRVRAGLDQDVVRAALVQAIRHGRFSADVLTAMAERFGTAATREFVLDAVREAA